MTIAKLDLPAMLIHVTRVYFASRPNPVREQPQLIETERFKESLFEIARNRYRGPFAPVCVKLRLPTYVLTPQRGTSGRPTFEVTLAHRRTVSPPGASPSCQSHTFKTTTGPTIPPQLLLDSVLRRRPLETTTRRRDSGLRGVTEWRSLISGGKTGAN